MTSKKILSENAQKVGEARHFMEGENWESCVNRVSKFISNAETKDKIKHEQDFNDIIGNMDFIPGGRIIRNSGRIKGSLFNCYVLGIEDSRSSIGNFYKESLVLWGSGGGVGCNFSPLRPKGAPINGVGGTSSGLVSFMEAADAIAKTVESGGSRRAAALGCIEVSHPEVLDFIDAKLVHGKLSHFNISVIVNDEFIEAVEKDNDWELKFNQKVYGKVKARVIWDKIIDNMIKCAEPGLLNGTNLFKNNSYYYDPIVSTNPCGEVALENGGICCLGSLNLPNFISTTNTNWKKLENTIKVAVRMLDNIIELNQYELEINKLKAHNSRRIGIGVMGLADYLFAKQIRYGSTQSILEIEKLMKFIRDCCYTSSVELAMEKGAFPKFDPVAYGKASFIRKLPASLRTDIKNNGIRNVTLMAVAPTGSISLLSETTPSIEPLFSKAYRRNDRVGERIYIHPRYLEIIKSGSTETPDWFVDASDLTPEDHLEVQSIVQKYVDGAVSKTINMPFGTGKEKLEKLLIEYIHDLKGMTIYVDGSREGQIYNNMSYSEVINYLSQDNKISGMGEEAVQCPTGTCSI